MPSSRCEGRRTKMHGQRRAGQPRYPDAPIQSILLKKAVEHECVNNRGTNTPEQGAKMR